MSGYNFEIKGIDNFLKDINNIQNNFREDLQKLIEKHGGILLRNTKMKTPVGQYNDGRTGGTLRRSWELEKGDLYVKLMNRVEYGIFVEWGHRTRGGKSYVEGVYMLKTSFEKTKKDFENDLEKLLKKYSFK
nr:MAG TPA: putative tail-component [Caudoviricetes sp.]